MLRCVHVLYNLAAPLTSEFLLVFDHLFANTMEPPGKLCSLQIQTIDPFAVRPVFGLLHEKRCTRGEMIEILMKILLGETTDHSIFALSRVHKHPAKVNSTNW